MILKRLFLVSIVLALFSCGESNVNNENTNAVDSTGSDSIVALEAGYTITLSQSALESVLKSIPSPLEFADDLVKLNIPFDDKKVAEVKNTDDFITEDSKAIATGIYGTDLSYINIFNEKFNALIYYKTVVSLAKDLRVEQFFNLETVEKLQENEGNSEKLLEIVRSGYKDIHAYLKKQNRSHLSTYMLYGSWLESCYITLQTHDPKSFDLKDKIGEQKITINKMRAIFSSLDKKGPTSDKILKELKELNAICGHIEISYSYDGAETTSKDQEIDLVETQTKKIVVDEATIANMKAKVIEIRKSYLQ